MSRKPRNAEIPPAKIYQLKIVLHDIKPAIWRRLLVRADMNLGLLHAVIQVAMGWTNSHLHQFIVDDTYYADPAFELDTFPDQEPTGDESRTLLTEVAPRKGDTFTYEYDFGDSWIHKIRVEKILPADPSRTVFAECIGGARACPPEDSGGPWSYEELLDKLEHPKRKDYQELIEWLGGPFDPEAFDLDTTNRYLRKLKWPRTTMARLAQVLMQLDDARA